MPRKARIDYPGLTHHVMARTFNDLLLFRGDEDRQQYLSYFSDRIRECGFLCFAWVLMDTHVHFLIKTSEKPLWRFMKPLHSDYSRWYNRKYNRRGPLFIDRFKSIATQDQYYVEQLVRYIHLNPVRAGVCKDLSELRHYRWSGHGMLMGEHTNSFQSMRPVLQRFGRAEKEGRRRYEQYLQEALDKGYDETVSGQVRRSNEGTRDSTEPSLWVIGDHEFQELVLQKDRERRVTIAEYRKRGIGLDDLLQKVSKAMKVSGDQVLKHSKRTDHAEARKVLCYYASMLGIPSKETGVYLGIQQAAVSHASRKGGYIARERHLQIVIEIRQ